MQIKDIDQGKKNFIFDDLILNSNQFLAFRQIVSQQSKDIISGMFYMSSFFDEIEDVMKFFKRYPNREQINLTKNKNYD
ncbi:unnamed protein product [Paramecium sonneborni]|uniref:Uncharacterized protein n=1 Tax=Paramecium sonneborni TaxID=65129 RepID=A0A8S1M2Q5_9CILI|nr:unnamed protein product [Paramecium sonneborni]